ncbi:FAD-binding oxidoreductase [Novosphingobium sp. LASN5T]|uniref:FAD-binding oxidoreductase n=1 Tax=Novosphingobium sp. LASN5T TaxID=2491021 RepID=UPI000F5E98CF|nr:FAD-binding oxidoreductase [Novosphingobium sp. LASN5T]RQW41366.1 FAD-binding oxidoreductase [Novosphingobium sp. LASN5T]
MSAQLALGVSAQQFAQALTAMRAAVGPEWVFASDEDITAYSDHFAFEDVSVNLASAIVAPLGLDQITRIIAIARDHQIPVWAISTGRNLAYGGSAPRKRGTLTLDLKRNNRILEVNEELAYAVVEPGVSFFQLYRHLREIGSKLWIDTPSPGWGGIMGNMLERGVGYTPYGDRFMWQCGMQVVLADGTVVDTGMAAQDGSQPGNHTYRYGSGPWIDGIFTQSNFGIVTKVGIQLMPEPPGYRPFLVTFAKDEDIAPVSDLIRPLKMTHVIPNAAVTCSLNLEAATSLDRTKYHADAGPLPEAARLRMMADLNVGKWNFYAALYGPEPVMDAHWEVIRDSFATVKGARFFTAEDRKGDVVFGYRTKLMRGEPNMTEFGILNWMPNGAHLGFSPVAPVDGKTALDQYRFAEAICNRHGFDYTGMFIVGFRAMHHIIEPIFSRSDEDQRSRLIPMVTELIDEAAKRGYGEYRGHLSFMDQIAGTYGWGDNALMKLSQRIKRALDPTGIMAPGKSGIWPEKASS